MQPDRLYVTGMITACARVLDLVAGRDVPSIEADETVREALLWNFTVLGEAASQVSEATKQAHTDIPWRRMTATRNRIVHGYWSADLDVLVTTAREAIPDVAQRLTDLLEELPS